MTTQVSVSRNDTSCAVFVKLKEQAAAAPFEQRLQDLEDRQECKRVEYAQRLRIAVEKEAAGRYPHLEIVVDVDLDRWANDEPVGYETPEAQLLQRAINRAPLPGSGLAPRDYPPGPIGYQERAAARLPHTRVRPGDPN